MVKKIFVIAGETSGDLHGAKLIESLRSQAARRSMPLEIHGVGGEKIQKTGALSFYDLAHFHATGFTDALLKIPRYKKAFDILVRDLEKTRPDLVVLIDNPGFNFRLAERIHARQIPIVYYIAPQLWAWNEKRIFKMKRWAKKVLVVFDFEKALYEQHGIPVAFVGHPLKDGIPAPLGSTDPRSEKNAAFTLTLMPGSRKGELQRLLSVFLDAAKIIQGRFPEAGFQIIQAPSMPWDLYEKAIAKRGLPVRIIDKDAYAAIAKSDLVLVCSGTATLECALLGTPMIISYRGSFLTYQLAKRLIKVPHIGLPNLILNEGKFPELLQNDATAEKLAQTAIQILEQEATRREMKMALKEVSNRLGPPGASAVAAGEILNLL